MPDPVIRTVQCAYCLRHSVNVTHESGLDDDGNNVETEVARSRANATARSRNSSG
jgi:hypothetical protein